MKNKVLLTFGICTLLAVFFLGQQYFYDTSLDREFHLLSNLVYQLFYFYSWGIFFFIIVFLAEKFRIEKKNLARALVVHFIAAVIIAVLHRIFTIYPHLLLFAPDKLAKVGFTIFSTKILGAAFDSFLAYWMILGLYYAYIYYNELKQSKLQASELEKQLAQSELQALKMQLQPHFLFNTMHAISTLMEEDVKNARKMIAKLSDLLRQTLDSTGEIEVPLKKEIEFIKNYLEIEQIRFGDRLKVKFEVDNNTNDLFVPNLILQPIVENSIKHGISKSRNGGEIIIKSSIEQNILKLIVSDDCSKGTVKFKEGFGLRNTRERIEQLYGGSGSIEIKTEHGFETVISIPVKTN